MAGDPQPTGMQEIESGVGSLSQSRFENGVLRSMVASVNMDYSFLHVHIILK